MKARALFLKSARYAATAAVVLAAALSNALAQWAPKQPVEIMVPNSPGGGVDRTGRALQKIMQERQLVPNSLVVNKAGGSGAVGWAYLDKHAGNPHVLGVATLTLLTSHITGRSTYNYTEFTPIAQLFSEYIAFAVKPDSPIASWNDLVSRMKKDPTSVSIGSTNREGAAALAFALAMRQHGVDNRKVKIVVFNSAGEAMTAAMGGHIDAVAISAETVKRQLQENRARALALSSPQRAHGIWANVPTLREQGTDVVFGSWRGVLAPKDIAPAQIAYWDQVFAKLVASDDWKKEMAAQEAASDYQNSASSRTYLKNQYDQLKGVLIEMGLAKGQ